MALIQLWRWQLQVNLEEEQSEPCCCFCSSCGGNIKITKWQKTEEDGKHRERWPFNALIWKPNLLTKRSYHGKTRGIVFDKQLSRPGGHLFTVVEAKAKLASVYKARLNIKVSLSEIRHLLAWVEGINGCRQTQGHILRLQLDNFL